MDGPDFLRPAPSQFVGALSPAVSPSWATTTVTVAPWVSALMFQVPSVYSVPTWARVHLHGSTAYLYSQFVPFGQWQVVPINAAQGTSWDIDLQQTGAGTVAVMVYLVSAPLVSLVSANAGLSVTPRKQPTTAGTFYAPAANTIAKITRTGVAGYRWVVDAISALMINGGGAASAADVSITDGGVITWNYRMTISAIGGTIDRLAIPIGYLAEGGNDVVIGFTSAPGASNYERISVITHQEWDI